MRCVCSAMIRSAFACPAMIFAMSFVISVPLANADDPSELIIWPNGHPEPKVSAEPAEALVKGPDGLTRRFNVSSPRLFVYRPAKEIATGAAIIVVPGGGFGRLSDEHEGSDVCRWLASLGIVSIELAYRTPTNKHANPVEGPAQDLQQAFLTVRDQAEELKIDPQKVGVMGFSAGGQTALVAMAGKKVISFDGDPQRIRPNLALLIYPYQVMNSDATAIRADVDLGSALPPVFIAQSLDDKASPPQGSAMLLIELVKRQIPAELHIYETGGHGFGMRHRTPPPGARDWSDRAAVWLRLHQFAAELPGDVAK
jgi:acetyl esterase/lipase